jgi:hypothetical protein
MFLTLEVLEPTVLWLRDSETLIMIFDKIHIKSNNKRWWGYYSNNELNCNINETLINGKKRKKQTNLIS